MVTNTKEIEKIIKRVQVDADKRLSAYMERYMGSLKEDFEDQIKGLADNVAGVQEKVDNVAADMLEIKSDIKRIKFEIIAGLNDKADKKHVVDLDTRLRRLEKPRK